MRKAGNRTSTLAALALAGALAAGAAAAQAEGDEAREAFARMDSNRDGQLSLEEFEKGIQRPFGAHGDGVVYQKLPARFRAMDADESGFLEPAEYASLPQRWHGAGTPPDFATADQGGDGRVDFREFARLHAPADAGPQAAEDGTAAAGSAEGAARR